MVTHTVPKRKSDAAAKDAPAQDAKSVPEAVTKAAAKPAVKPASVKSQEKTEPTFRPPPPKTETAAAAKAPAPAPAVSKAPAPKTEPAKPAPVDAKPAADTKPAPKAVDTAVAGSADSNAKPPAKAEANPDPVVQPVTARPPASEKAPALETSDVKSPQTEVSAPKSPAVEPTVALAAKPVASAAANPSFGVGASSASFTEINETMLAFARKEGEAALAHMQALAKVKSPAELIRLQVGEFQRAADSSLSCISTIVRSASRLGGARIP